MMANSPENNKDVMSRGFKKGAAIIGAAVIGFVFGGGFFGMFMQGSAVIVMAAICAGCGIVHAGKSAFKARPEKTAQCVPYVASSVAGAAVASAVSLVVAAAFWNAAVKKVAEMPKAPVAQTQTLSPNP